MILSSIHVVHEWQDGAGTKDQEVLEKGVAGGVAVHVDKDGGEGWVGGCIQYLGGWAPPTLAGQGAPGVCRLVACPRGGRS